VRDLLHRCLLVTIALGAAATPPAVADDAASTEALALSWDAPPGCPSRTQVLAEVARLLGGTIAMPQGGSVEARASVVQGPKWSVSLTTRNAGQAGRRSLEAASCQDLADATALIVALMIDPDAVAAHAGIREVEEPAPPPTAPPPAPRPAGRPIDVWAAMHGQASLGVLPGVDAGVGAGVGLGGQRWRVELRGTYGLRRDQTARSSAAPAAYGQFNFLGGALAACINLGGDAIAFGPCAGAEAGMVSAKGYGVSVGFPARTAWLALGAGGYAAIALGPHLAIPVHVDVLAPLRRPRYVIKDMDGTVFQASAVGVRLVAGIEWRF
jgi:hypothetical protein